MAFYRAAIGGGGGIPAECKCILYKTSANINIIDYNYITISGNTVTFLKACEGYIQAGRGSSATVSGTATFTNLIHKTESYTGDLFSFSASVGDTLTVSNSAAFYDWSLYIADGVASPIQGGISGSSYSIGNNGSQSFTMKNGVYFTHRTDGSNGYVSYVKGFVQNGVLIPIHTDSYFTVSYNTSTNELTVSKPNTTNRGTNVIYFFKMN